jgi:uncharacterized protein YjbJ (UPF0337 family)
MTPRVSYLWPHDIVVMISDAAFADATLFDSCHQVSTRVVSYALVHRGIEFADSFLRPNNMGDEVGAIARARFLLISKLFNSKECTMNEDRLKGKWNQIKGELKKKWGKLTDDDLTYGEGQIDKMMGRIQERTGEKKEEIQKFFNRYLEDKEDSAGMRH